MKKVSRWCSMYWIVLLICIGFSSQSIAEDNLPALIKKIQPSVVLVTTYDDKGYMLGQGSGFFINKDANLVTNYHVLKGASSAKIKTNDGKIYTIKNILSESRESDLVLFSADIPTKNVNPYISINKTIPPVGEKIIVIGNPQSLEWSATDGIVSAVRIIPEFGNTIQFSAPISPGSSGSPLINMKGEVIGIVEFQTNEGQSFNFAIPIEKIEKLSLEKKKTFAEWAKENKNIFAGEFYFKGLSYITMGDFERAIPCFEEAIKIEQHYAQAYFQLGYCYSGLFKYKESIDNYKKVIELKKDSAETYTNMGVACVNLGNYEEAITYYKQAMNMGSKNAMLYSNLGVAYDGIGKYKEAIECYKKAIKIKPDLSKAYFNLGIVYSKIGEHQNAIDSYKKVINIRPNYSEAYNNLGWDYSALGNNQEAIKCFEQAIKIKPDNFEAYCNLGISYGKLGNNNESINAFIDAIKIKPDYAEAHKYLGCAYLKINDKTLALDEYKILKNLNNELANQLFDMVYKKY